MVNKKIDKVVDRLLGEEDNSSQSRLGLPIRKDLNSLRAKGVMMEDIASFLYHDLEINQVAKGSGIVDYYGGYAHRAKNAEDTIEFLETGSRMGIPSVVVWCDTQQTWLALQAKLRQAKLIR